MRVTIHQKETNMKWKVESPEVQAAAIMAALEHMRSFPPNINPQDRGHIKSDWIKSLEVRASEILKAFTSVDTGE
jgi:hypothetical protein